MEQNEWMKWMKRRRSEAATQLLGTYRRVMPLRMRFDRERFASTPVIYKTEGNVSTVNGDSNGSNCRERKRVSGGPRPPHLVGGADDCLALVVQVHNHLLTNGLCA
jgi:hypothetical protein